MVFLSETQVRKKTGGAGAPLLALAFDRAAVHRFQQPAQRRDARVGGAATGIGWLGDPGALTLSAGTFVVGRVAHHDGLADAGLHAAQAIVFGGATTNALKFIIGRARPREVASGEAFVFRPGRGISDYASFPSGHTTAAFVAAFAASAELSCSTFAQSYRRIGRAAPFLLYIAAALVGVSRMYHDAHWADRRRRAQLAGRGEQGGNHHTRNIVRRNTLASVEQNTLDLAR